jgi:drug/metabolite transporter (DMT)-like permease
LGVGLAQLLQKNAINRLERTTKSPWKTRFTQPRWILGILLNYISEFGNWYAVSIAPASLITPLGIVSVLVNIIFAKLYLKEQVTRDQQRGYTIILMGVFVILYGAPRKQVSIGTTLEEILHFCFSSKMRNGMLFLCAILSVLIFMSRRLGNAFLLYRYVLICSYFGSFSITCTKIVAALIHVVQTDSDPNSAAQTYRVMLIISGMSMFSTLLQETYKQKSLSMFPVSRFTPLLFSAFNAK